MTKLDNICINGRNISANLSKYKRKEIKFLLPTKEASKIATGGGWKMGEGRTSELVNDNISRSDLNRNNKSFVEALKSNSTNRGREEGETCKFFYFNSNIEDRRKYIYAKVGVMNVPGKTYGVGRSQLEEGIFSIQAIPLGPNLCLLEEKYRR